MAPKPHATTSSSSLTSLPHDSDAPNITRERNAFASLKQSLLYAYSPSSHPSASRPSSLRTRALLRSLHYFGVFIFWRLRRWAKYALYGALVAGIGGILTTGALSGVGLLAAPLGLTTTAVAATVWGVGKHVWRWIWKRRVNAERRKQGLPELEGHEQTVYAKEPDLQAVPW